MALLTASSAAQTKSNDPTVVFNTETLIYHRPSCRWALRCMRNCVSATLSEARNSGGRACKVCGGGGALVDATLAGDHTALLELPSETPPCVHRAPSKRNVVRIGRR
jgi:methylphosphotriester-DNA--protein-cysteine methyltransferase